MFSFFTSLVMSGSVDENACDANCAAAGQRFVYLEKSLFNIETLFGKIDGDHPYVRKWVLHAVGDDSTDALFGHSSFVRTEMIAVGMQHKIEQHVAAFLKSHCCGNGVEAFLLLVQNTGYFPLAIFFTREVDVSCEISVDQARAMLDGVYTFLVLHV